MARREAAIDARLEEFFDWAEQRWAEAAQERVRLVAPRHLLTEHPLRTQSLDALTNAVLNWALTHEFFHLVFGKHSWFRPVQYGRAFTNGRLDPDHIDFDALVAFYDRYRNITVTARTEQDYLLVYPMKPGDPPYLGRVIWGTAAKRATKVAWRAAHAQQVLDVMQLLRAPLIQAGLDEDLARKTRRHVMHPDGLSMMETATVRGYSEGLPGLVWRNFFGPPFVQMFGERLTSLPSEFKQDLGGGIVLVQPYELPSQAGTPEAAARERELIAHLGPECFYDHERHLKPTRVPDLTSLQPF